MQSEIDRSRAKQGYPVATEALSPAIKRPAEHKDLRPTNLPLKADNDEDNLYVHKLRAKQLDQQLQAARAEVQILKNRLHEMSDLARQQRDLVGELKAQLNNQEANRSKAVESAEERLSHSNIEAHRAKMELQALRDEAQQVADQHSEQLRLAEERHQAEMEEREQGYLANEEALQM